MRRRLSRILWSFALAGSVTVTGCADRGGEHAAIRADEARRATYTRSTAGAAMEGAPSPVATADGKQDSEENAPMSERSAKPMVKAEGKRLRRLPNQAMKTARSPGPGQVVAANDNSEQYTNYGVNPLVETANDNRSTFAIDVDTASYAIARRKIVNGQLPPPSSVRVEEFINYFGYDYASPNAGAFAVHMDAAPSPFNKGRHVLRVGVQGKKLSIAERTRANLVFLVDVSGSMNSADKLGMAKRALRVLVNNLKDGDTVSLVTYAGNTRVVLRPTPVENRSKIFNALEDLTARGSTAMNSGIDLAYGLAAEGLGPDSLSRVVVLSDGDANVGSSSHQEILKTIAGRVKEGVTLSTIGLGMGNYKDTLMEQLANKGNGNYYYIDSLSEAKKVFQQQLGGTLEVIAKDVKIQVEFDKDVVKRYRLVGYENRNVADHDFRNDKVDAGEIGAGHAVTALYEVELTRTDRPAAIVRVRAKKPRGSKATEMAYTFDLANLAKNFDSASTDLRFATAVMGTAEILRRSPHARNWRLDQVRRIASEATASRPQREELVSLLDQLKRLESKLAIAD